MTVSTVTTAGIRASDRLPSVAGERGAEVGLTMTRRYDRNHHAVLEDQAGLRVVVVAHATSDQPARHRERLLARSERAVVHPRIPLVRARPGAAARGGTKSSTRLHTKHSHVTAPPQEPCPGSAGVGYDASQRRSCGAGSSQRDGKGRTRIRFRHAPVPGWACYGPAWASHALVQPSRL